MHRDTNRVGFLLLFCVRTNIRPHIKRCVPPPFRDHWRIGGGAVCASSDAAHLSFICLIFSFIAARVLALAGVCGVGCQTWVWPGCAWGGTCCTQSALNLAQPCRIIVVMTVCMSQPHFWASCHHSFASVFVGFGARFFALRTSPRSARRVAGTSASGSASIAGARAGVTVSKVGMAGSASFERSTGL